MAKKKSKTSKAGKAGVTVGLAARGFNYAKTVDWPAVWMRAQWLQHHTKRLYSNLSESERKEFLNLVVPTKDQPFIAGKDRGRVQELVTKAFTGGSPK
ncbi:MAG: hypothetical protein IPK93_00805 [Solirubrobacterales bacterium]|nr:hypothetical protein [Solirubrobacterales bacterium]